MPRAPTRRSREKKNSRQGPPDKTAKTPSASLVGYRPTSGLRRGDCWNDLLEQFQLFANYFRSGVSGIAIDTAEQHPQATRVDRAVAIIDLAILEAARTPVRPRWA